MNGRNRGAPPDVRMTDVMNGSLQTIPDERTLR
jgi:hypothetical protein